MKLEFYKYQGAGNDFVMIDNRNGNFSKNNTDLIAKLCDRRFGVGADGLILLEGDAVQDFNMVYYNADGNESTMCGNGGRCLVAFAKFLGVIKDKAAFNAIDGLHTATIKDGIVTLQMKDVSEIRSKNEYYFLDTGSPHHVQLVSNVDAVNVPVEGKKLRYGLYGQTGSNINFVTHIKANEFSVRTYERGVEDETLACGTGVTAVAIAMHKAGVLKENHAKIKVLGGNLEVLFNVDESGYSTVMLVGPAKQVFKGSLEI